MRVSTLSKTAMLSKTAVEDRSLTKSNLTLPKRTSTYALRHGTLTVQTLRLGPYWYVRAILGSVLS
jgi:hypothetical protein